jgi:hypothetical protein
LSAPLRMICNDEISFTSASHYYACHRQADASMKALGVRPSEEGTFGDLHMVHLGDFKQHQPPGGEPLFYKENPDAPKHKSDAIAGNTLWEANEDVFYLEAVHRFNAAEADGAELLRFAGMFASTSDPSQDDIEELVDALQAKYVADLHQYAHLKPKCLVLRHIVREPLDRRLAFMHAKHMGKRVVLWRSLHIAKDKSPLDPSLWPFLEAVPSTDTGSGGVPAVGYFFEDCEYIFSDNEQTPLGRMRNNMCIGKRLVLDYREGPDDLTQAVRLLKYPPRGIYVRPEGVDVPTISDDPQLAGCVYVASHYTGAVKQQLPFTIPVGNKEVSSISFKRWGLPLSGAYAVTDYFCQGASFKTACWFVHLTPPPGRMARASVLVALTRFPSWSSIKLIAPLYNPAIPGDREQVVKRYMSAARMDPLLQRELQRLHTLADATTAKYSDHVEKVLRGNL